MLQPDQERPSATVQVVAPLTGELDHPTTRKEEEGKKSPGNYGVKLKQLWVSGWKGTNRWQGWGRKGEGSVSCILAAAVSLVSRAKCPLASYGDDPRKRQPR